MYNKLNKNVFIDHLIFLKDDHHRSSPLSSCVPLLRFEKCHLKILPKIFEGLDVKNFRNNSDEQQN